MLIKILKLLISRSWVRAPDAAPKRDNPNIAFFPWGFAIKISREIYSEVEICMI